VPCTTSSCRSLKGLFRVRPYPPFNPSSANKQDTRCPWHSRCEYESLRFPFGVSVYLSKSRQLVLSRLRVFQISFCPLHLILPLDLHCWRQVLGMLFCRFCSLILRVEPFRGLLDRPTMSLSVNWRQVDNWMVSSSSIQLMGCQALTTRSCCARGMLAQPVGVWLKQLTLIRHTMLFRPRVCALSAI
jgi:hypothetical protein